MIVNILETTLAFVLVLAPLVFIHEFGHFIVAKAFGIGVPTFSLGFGPKLFGFDRGGTNYRVSLIPLGGYVRLAGDEADANRTGAANEFLSRPRYQRFLVYVAGATFNIALAFIVFWAMFGVYGKTEIPERYPVVMGLLEDGSAYGSGLRRGDRIIEIDDVDIRNTQDFLNMMNLEIILAPNTTKPFLIERDGRRETLQLNTGEDPDLGHGRPGWSLSWGGDDPPIVGQVVNGDPASRAGLLTGDRILGAQGQRPISELDLRVLLESHAGQPVDLVIGRETDEIELTVTPHDVGGKGKIGVSFLPAEGLHVDLTWSEAARESLQANLVLSRTLFVVLKRLVTAEVPLSTTVSGPIGIAQFSRQALTQGFDQFLYLLGFFSLQLGILNLLPIPVLDGGHILILGIEAVMRRELSEKLKERVMQVGFVFLLAFMGLVIFFDIAKIIP